MRSFLGPWMATCLLSTATAGFAATPAALIGCWRAQQMDVVLGNGANYSKNGDCVISYDRERAAGRCRVDGDKLQDKAYRVESTDASTLRLTPLDPDSGQALDAPYEMRYRIEGEWMVMERNNPGATGKEQASFRSVSIRERGNALGDQACKPHGQSKLRIGRTPVSSLQLQAPATWHAWLVDLSQNKHLGGVVGQNLLIGAFFQGERQPSDDGAGDFVLVLDDTRHGAQPISTARFAEVRQRFAKEVLPKARVTCNEPDRICALMSVPGQKVQVYTELFNLKGRVAMITVRAADAKPQLLVERARTFTAQLQVDNP